ncbi:MAG: hypothetical protein QXI18_01170 [Nitrososphaerota archaeon]
MDETKMVVEALMKVGPRFTDISRATGIPISTVRYILLKRLPKLGLSIRAHINYGALGLQRYLVEFQSNYPPHYISRLLDMMGEMMYLDYYTYSMNKRKFFAIFAIPPKHERSFIEFMQILELLGLVRDSKIRKLVYMKLLPFMTECFDFSRGVWMQDWIDRPHNREIQEIIEYPNLEPKIDKIDLIILAELQRQVIPLRYAFFAKKFGLSRQTISKHYKHVRNFIDLFAVIWFPFKNPELVLSPLLIETAYNENDRKIIINIPFTYAEMKSEKGEYFAFIWAPSIGLYSSVKILTKFVEVEELHFQDLEYSGKFSIQYQLYEKGSWMDPFEKGVQNLLEMLQKREEKGKKLG